MKKYKTHFALIAILLSSFLVSCDKGYTLAGGASGNDNYANDYREYTHGYCAQLNDTTEFNCYYVVNLDDIRTLYGDAIYESQLRLYNAMDGNNHRSYIIAKVSRDRKIDTKVPMYVPPPGSLCPDACDLNDNGFVLPMRSTNILRVNITQMKDYIGRANERYASAANVREVGIPGEVLRDYGEIPDCKYLLIHHVRVDDQPKVLIIGLTATGAVLRPEYYVVDGDNLCPDACDVF